MTIRRNFLAQNKGRNRSKIKYLCLTLAFILILFCINSISALTPTDCTNNFATGGVVSVDGNYCVHTFLTGGSFNVLSGSLTTSVLVVAGGGGGGGGGGGAGGLIYQTSYSVSGAKTITIGTGGAGGYNDGASHPGTNGLNSSFGSLQALGGGGGGAPDAAGGVENGLDGGSGGGAGEYVAGIFGYGFDSQGYNGGTDADNYIYGGGGGSNEAGGAPSGYQGTAGCGGNGTLININGTATYYAGGGGGGAYTTGYGTPCAVGGLGGGGLGSYASGQADSGVPHTGGGGGGGRGGYGGTVGGAGGSGIVIVRYLGVAAGTPPNVTLNSPINYLNTSSSSITFNCSSTDLVGVLNLTLVINGVDNYTITNSSAGQNLSLQTAKTLSDGNGNWSCRASSGGGTTNSSVYHFFVDTTGPIITFIEQEPINITSNNIYTSKLNISYSITDVSGVNASSITYYSKTNNTVNEIWQYINGTETTEGYRGLNGRTGVVISNASSIWNFNISSNLVYPSTFNLDPEVTGLTPKSVYTLVDKNNLLKIRIFNMTNNSYGTFNFMANSTAVADDLRIYFCNSSYVSGDITLTGNCGLLANFPSTQTYNYSLSKYSQYNFVPFDMNLTTNTISGIKVTPVDYFALRGTSTGNWYVSYVTNISQINTIGESTDRGVSYTNFSGTVNAFVSQYTPINYSNYEYICGSDNWGNNACSSVRVNPILPVLQGPSIPEVYSPTAGFYSGNITINYTSSESTAGMSYYNISLVNIDATHTFNKTITNNNSLNLSYIWNSVGTLDGNYSIEVKAVDLNNSVSIGYSYVFEIDNTPPAVQQGYTSGGIFIPAVNNSFTNNATVNFTTNVTSQLGLKNVTITITNSTGGIINQTTTTFVGTVLKYFFGIPLYLIDGAYHWTVNAYDVLSNFVTTGVMTLNVETTNPSITGQNYNITWPNDNGYLYKLNATITEQYINQTGIDFEGINYSSYNIGGNIWEYNFTKVLPYVPYTSSYFWWAINNATNYGQSSNYSFNVNCPAGYGTFNNSYCVEDLNFLGSQNITRYLSIPQNVLLTNGYLNLNNLNNSGLSNISISIGNNLAWINPGNITNCIATGGTVTMVGNYCINTFLTNGTFNTNGYSLNVTTLVVAGGGGGSSGASTGGGGGAGGLIYNNSYITSGSYNIVVGNGGSVSANGGNSTFGNLNALGGGAGGGIGAIGGSGGGGGHSGLAGGSGYDSQGNRGGWGGASLGGGGGGFSQVGFNSTAGQAGNGGAGIGYSFNGTTLYYAGGGGGAGAGGGNNGTGGIGGGGNGAKDPSLNATGGINGTGGGGGGGSSATPAAGGSGIVIIKYFANNVNQTSNLASYVNSYLSTCSYSGGYCQVPFIFHSDTSGTLQYFALNFNSTGFIENSQTYNATTYETSAETFMLNITTGESLISSYLNYAGSSYPVTPTLIGSNYIFSKTIDIPTIPTASVNNTFNWTITLGSSSSTTNSHIQTVNPINFTICNPSNPTPFINYTFKDEQTNIPTNAILTSSFNYYLGSGSVTKTYTYQNTTENPSYAFCALPSYMAYYVLPSLQYSNSNSTIRTSNAITPLILTNSTTNTVLSLLATSNGVYSSYQVVTSVQQPIANALVIAMLNGNIIESKTTDSSGIATFFLNPNIAYTIIASKSGFVTGTFIITPTQTTSPYTITLSTTGITNATSYNSGVTISISPATQYLNLSSSYNFQVNLTSIVYPLVNWGFNVTNENSTLGTITLPQSTTFAILGPYTINSQTVSVVVWWNINGTVLTFTKSYSVQTMNGSGFSIYNGIIDLQTYLNNGGIFGLTGASMNILIFIFILIVTGLCAYKFGLSSPAILAGIVTIQVFLFDVVFGLIYYSPSFFPARVPHVATVFMGIILIALIIREGTSY